VLAIQHNKKQKTKENIFFGFLAFWLFDHSIKLNAKYMIYRVFVVNKKKMNNNMAKLTYTSNVNGHKVNWGPFGIFDADLLSEQTTEPSSSSRGYLPRADGVRPDEFERVPDELERACEEAGVSLPLPTPILERQEGVVLPRASDQRILQEMADGWTEQRDALHSRLNLHIYPQNEIGYLEMRLDLLKYKTIQDKLDKIYALIRVL
jgi:hypothetical protein